MEISNICGWCVWSLGYSNEQNHLPHSIKLWQNKARARNKPCCLAIETGGLFENTASSNLPWSMHGRWRNCLPNVTQPGSPDIPLWHITNFWRYVGNTMVWKSNNIFAGFKLRTSPKEVKQVIKPYTGGIAPSRIPSFLGISLSHWRGNHSRQIPGESP